jgi:diguanylate cyclase (GGDEF)-like protein
VNSTKSTPERDADAVARDKVRPYLLVVGVAGVLIFLHSVNQLQPGRLDVRFILLALLTAAVSSRFSIRVPRVKTGITVTDTFVFLSLMLYGPEAAIIMAAVEGLGSGLRASRRALTVLFNASVSVCATFVTAQLLSLSFGYGFDLRELPAVAVVGAICLIALTQYMTSTGLAAAATSLRTGQRLGPTWKHHYLWSSITYFVGAFAAGLATRFDGTAGVFTLAVTLPVVSIIYFTYDKYLAGIKEAAAQAEQAERERAEQAERHVEELNRYISELERMSVELQKSKEHFRHAAFHDALTGLPNRALFLNHLQLAAGRARRNDRHYFAVLFFDLDRFKNVNDSLGHLAGDQLLIAIARRLEQFSRPADTVARTGGDEYAILLDGLQDMEDAARFAERLQKELSLPFAVAGQEVYVTASVGIALGSIGYDTPEHLLRDADIAMYRAKEKGKACYEVFDAVMHARAVALLRLENDLRRAIERQEFRVFYQPIVALETRRVVGFEALVRWMHPERGFVAPDEFIPLAEETGLIADIDRWVLREACRQMVEWQKLSPANRPLTLSANLSSKELTQDGIVEQIKTVLIETDFDPRCLRLEITESAVMENAEASANLLSELRDLGVRISIDDFGTGYSSLSYLHRFPVTTLKIDRSFIGRMSEDSENFEIVRTIMTLANNLGMDTVAEGVETERQLAQLRLLKCEYGQGYLFSRPIDADAAGQLLAHKPEARRTDASPAGDLINAPSSPYVN